MKDIDDFICKVALTSLFISLTITGICYVYNIHDNNPYFVVTLSGYVAFIGNAIIYYASSIFGSD